MKIFVVEDLDGQLTADAEMGLLRLVMASQRGEIQLKKRHLQVIGGPANGPDTIRVIVDIEVPLVQPGS